MFLLPLRGLPQYIVAGEGKSLFKPGPLGSTALHPLRRMRCKLQVEAPSDHTYSLFWTELSRLLGENIPVAIVGLEPGTLGSEAQCFSHLATKLFYLEWLWKCDSLKIVKNRKCGIWSHFANPITYLSHSVSAKPADTPDAILMKSSVDKLLRVMVSSNPEGQRSTTLLLRAIAKDTWTLLKFSLGRLTCIL